MVKISPRRRISIISPGAPLQRPDLHAQWLIVTDTIPSHEKPAPPAPGDRRKAGWGEDVHSLLQSMRTSSIKDGVKEKKGKRRSHYIPTSRRRALPERKSHQTLAGAGE